MQTSGDSKTPRLGGVSSLSNRNVTPKTRTLDVRFFVSEPRAPVCPRLPQDRLKRPSKRWNDQATYVRTSNHTETRHLARLSLGNQHTRPLNINSERCSMNSFPILKFSRCRRPCRSSPPRRVSCSKDPTAQDPTRLLLGCCSAPHLRASGCSKKLL